MSADIRDLRDEALRKIGRNVVNFQKIEALLKALIVISKIEGTRKDLVSRQAERAAANQRRPLGEIVKALHKNLYQGSGPLVTPDDLSEIWFSASFRIEAEPAIIKEHRHALSALVSERNRLIHRDLAAFDDLSGESCSHLITVLDEQNERIIQQLEALKRVASTMKELAGVLQEWANSDEFLEFLDQKGRLSEP